VGHCWLAAMGALYRVFGGEKFIRPSSSGSTLRAFLLGDSHGFET